MRITIPNIAATEFAGLDLGLCKEFGNALFCNIRAFRRIRVCINLSEKLPPQCLLAFAFELREVYVDVDSRIDSSV